MLRFSDQVPELPEIPGLLQSVRAEGELSLVIANFNGRAEEMIGQLGAEHVEQVPLDLEDALIGYLGGRGERTLFLQGVGGP